MGLNTVECRGFNLDILPCITDLNGYRVPLDLRTRAYFHTFTFRASMLPSDPLFPVLSLSFCLSPMSVVFPQLRMIRLACIRWTFSLLRLDSHRTPFPYAARPCNKFYLVIRRKLLCFTCEYDLGQKTIPCYFATILAVTFSFATTLSISALE